MAKGRLVAVMVGLSLGFAGSSGADDRPTLRSATLDTPPVIDGEIGAEEWATATVSDVDFIQLEPEVGQPSPFRTRVRFGQTTTSLFVAVELFDPDPDRISEAVTSRDGDLDEDDAVGIGFDTFHDGRTAYVFATNVLGTQLDARVADNGRTTDTEWDAAWSCAARRTDFGWTAEFEIPLEILRFASGTDLTWGFTVVRLVPRRLETSLWSGPSEDTWRVSSFGTITGLELPRGGGKRWLAIPYGLVAVEKDGATDFEIGGDFRWRPSNALGVDLTVNPDFALIEADVEEINLTRFELFIPEKRPFFLEGNEMYSQRIRQFYSRRIGDIPWGAKSTGTFGKTDFSVIATSEDIEVAEAPDTSADYGIARFQHSLPGGSTVGLLGANRRKEGIDQGSVGLDTTLFFTETLGMTAQLLTVHGPEADGGLAWFIRPAYDSTTTHFHVRYTNLDQGIEEDFNAVGFLRDDDRREFDTNFTHTFWLDRGATERIRAEINYNRYTSQENVLRSWELDAEFSVIFRSGWEVEIDYVEEFQLFEKDFRNNITEIKAGWNSRDGRSVSASFGQGVNFDSDLTLYGAEVEWAMGDAFRLGYSLTRLVLDPDPENETTWIHVLETDYSFNPDFFIKLFFQTNSAIDKVNVQLVWVWRFIPPFGSLQVAYQRGTSETGEVSDQGDTLFTKLSWVF